MGFLLGGKVYRYIRACVVALDFVRGKRRFSRCGYVRTRSILAKLDRTGWLTDLAANEIAAVSRRIGFT
jgi:hypothetical protein